MNYILDFGNSNADGHLKVQIKYNISITDSGIIVDNVYNKDFDKSIEGMKELLNVADFASLNGTIFLIKDKSLSAYSSMICTIMKSMGLTDKGFYFNIEVMPEFRVLILYGDTIDMFHCAETIVDVVKSELNHVICNYSKTLKDRLHGLLSCYGDFSEDPIISRLKSDIDENNDFMIKFMSGGIRHAVDYFNENKSDDTRYFIIVASSKDEVSYVSDRFDKSVIIEVNDIYKNYFYNKLYKYNKYEMGFDIDSYNRNKKEPAIKYMLFDYIKNRID